MSIQHTFKVVHIKELGEVEPVGWRIMLCFGQTRTKIDESSNQMQAVFLTNKVGCSTIAS